MRRLRALSVLLVAGVSLGGCTLVSTSSAPDVISHDSVPLGLLDPTIPFTDYAQVHFVTRDIFLVDRSQQVVPVGRLVPSPPSPLDVVHYVATGPTLVEGARGITTQIPANVTVNQATIHNGVALIDLSNTLAQIPPVGRRVAVAQFLFTAQALGAFRGIQITINQTPFALTLANGHKVTLITPAQLAYLKKK